MMSLFEAFKNQTMIFEWAILYLSCLSSPIKYCYDLYTDDTHLAVDIFRNRTP